MCVCKTGRERERGQCSKTPFNSFSNEAGSHDANEVHQSQFKTKSKEKVHGKQSRKKSPLKTKSKEQIEGKDLTIYRFTGPEDQRPEMRCKRKL